MTSLVAGQAYGTPRRGRKMVEKKKRKRHTWVKRPTTAYLYFVSKYRETLKEAGEVVPKAKIITQACAEKWRNMCDDEKEPFLELSRRDRERWQRDKALEKKPRDPNRPKRPPSAYFLFLAEFRKSYAGKSDPAKEITKKAGEAWNALTDVEKTPYYRDAQVIRNKWEQDLEVYKQSQLKNPPNVAGGSPQHQQQQQQPQHQQQQQQSEIVAGGVCEQLIESGEIVSNGEGSQQTISVPGMSQMSSFNQGGSTSAASILSMDGSGQLVSSSPQQSPSNSVVVGGMSSSSSSMSQQQQQQQQHQQHEQHESPVINTQYVNYNHHHAAGSNNNNIQFNG